MSRRLRSLLRFLGWLGGLAHYCGFGAAFALGSRTLDFRRIRLLTPRAISSITIERQDRLAHLQLLALFYVDLADCPAARTWHFDGRLVRLQFDDGLVLLDVIARLDQQLHQVSGGDVFTEFGQRDFCAHPPVLPLCVQRVGLLGIDLEVLDCLTNHFWLHLAIFRKRVQRGQSNEARINFEEVTQRRTGFAAPEAVSTESDNRPRTPA